MRPSPFRHPLAVLRGILQLGQREMGVLAGCSRATIQAVELLSLKLSEELAVRISQATGASEAWLLQGDPNLPAIDVHGEPYTRETFENLRAGQPTVARGPEFPLRFLAASEALHFALKHAKKSGKLRWVDYKITDAILHTGKVYMEDLPDFLGDSEALVSPEFPEVLRDLLLAQRLMIEQASAESFDSTKRELAELTEVIAEKLESEAREFRALAVAIKPSRSPSPKPPKKEKAPKTAPRPSASRARDSAEKPSPANSPSAEPKQQRPRSAPANKIRKSADKRSSAKA